MRIAPRPFVGEPADTAGHNRTSPSSRIAHLEASMSIYLAAILIGITAGLRTFTPPAVLSWAAYLGWLAVHDTTFAFLGFWAVPWIFTLVGLAELVWDKLPTTPSRKDAMGFRARLVSGALCGA